MTVVLLGANRPKLANITVRQKTITTENGTGKESLACYSSRERVCPSSTPPKMHANAIQLMAMGVTDCSLQLCAEVNDDSMSSLDVIADYPGAIHHFLYCGKATVKPKLTVV